MRPVGNALARFTASYVVKQMPGVDPKLGPCHVWQGSLNENGYGLFSPQGGRHSRRMVAHKYIDELFNGPLPRGWDRDHRCRVRACVNRGHLERVPHRVNIFRGSIGSATHCRHGHPLPPPVLGRLRRCKACAALSKQRARLKRDGARGTDGRA
jgi:hypothetical protein